MNFIINITFTSTTPLIGLLASNASKTTIENCSITSSSITTTYNNIFICGMLCGSYNKGTINKCYVSGNINNTNNLSSTSISYIGGFIGQSNTHTITNSYSNVNFITTSINFDSIGGLIGYGDSCNITACYSSGTMTYTNNSNTGKNLTYGGLIGRILSNLSTSSITNSYYNSSGITNTINRTLNSLYIGGLIGETQGPNTLTITNCYSATAITPSAVNTNNKLGGTIGFIVSGTNTASNTFYDNTLYTGTAIGDGLLSSGSITGTSTTNMKTLSTFTTAGWDFSIWKIVNGSTYPQLYETSNLITTPTNKFAISFQLGSNSSSSLIKSKNDLATANSLKAISFLFFLK